MIDLVSTIETFFERMVFWPLNMLDLLFNKYGQDLGGVPGDHLKIVTYMFLAVPISFIFCFLKDKERRYTYGMFVGVFFMYSSYRNGFFLILAQTIVAYLITMGYRENAGKIVLIERHLFLFNSKYIFHAIK